MNDVCRYCRTRDYPFPEFNGILSLDRWGDEWAHIMCYAEVMEWSTKILTELFMKVNHAVMRFRAKRHAQ